MSRSSSRKEIDDVDDADDADDINDAGAAADADDSDGASAVVAAARDERAQTGPVPALAATVVVGAALALYASTLYGAFPTASDPHVAEPTLEGAAEAVVVDGVARPDDLASALDAAPAGYDAAVVLVADDERWRVGPASPPDTATAARPVSVRVAPGVVVAGRLRVAVWR